MKTSTNKKISCMSNEDIERMFYLYGMLKIVTSDLMYYHLLTEYDELMDRFYLDLGKKRPSKVAIF